MNIATSLNKLFNISDEVYRKSLDFKQNMETEFALCFPKVVEFGIGFTSLIKT